MGRTINMAVLVVLVLAALQSTHAEDYDVGGDSGWIVPTTNSATFYATWASKITFRVGDTLEFNFTTGEHDVAVVSKEAYDTCNKTSPISLTTNGPATIPLNTTGGHYYICTFYNHCSMGQKLSINVVSATAAPSPTSPTTNGTTTSPPPPPPSSASSLTATISLIFFMSIAIAFLC